jgi:prepilin-type N-terminal cleavage/methylation domain-containing protein
MKKIRAFTILELVIVMVISSFITVAGYFAYTSSLSRLNIFQSSAAATVDLSEINWLLCHDFQDCKSASLVSPTQCLLKGDAGDVSYIFGKEFTLRKVNEQVDTFKLPVKKVSAVELDKSPVYITELILLAEPEKKEFTLVYHKQYDTSFLMNLDNL